MKKIFFAIVLLAFVLIGCLLLIGCVPGSLSGSSNADAMAQMPPPPTDLPPLPKDWKKQFESDDVNRIKFKDPDSAQYTYVGEPVLCQFGLKGGSGFVHGYCGRALINAKNSFGGYVGNQAAFYFFHTLNNEKTGHKTLVVMPMLLIGDIEVSKAISNPQL